MALEYRITCKGPYRASTSASASAANEVISVPTRYARVGRIAGSDGEIVGKDVEEADRSPHSATRTYRRRIDLDLQLGRHERVICRREGRGPHQPRSSRCIRVEHIRQERGELLDLRLEHLYPISNLRTLREREGVEPEGDVFGVDYGDPLPLRLWN